MTSLDTPNRSIQTMNESMGRVSFLSTVQQAGRIIILVKVSTVRHMQAIQAVRYLKILNMTDILKWMNIHVIMLV